MSTIHTIATRTWEEPTGQERDDRLAQLAAAAAGRTDLLAEAAGVLLGVRPLDEDDPRHRQLTYGAELLLEVAETSEDDPEVQRWVLVGEERRDRRRGAFQTGGLA